MPTSSQLRNALAYMSITVLVLVFLNIYSARATRDLMFKAKCSSSQDKLKVVTSSLSCEEEHLALNIRFRVAAAE